MKNEPLVTIGIPVYNEEKYLAETIESAINQSYQNLEIIISDNCSTDKSLDIIQKYATKDKRIVIIKHKENIGALNNFKYVLSRAKGDFFCWLGAHDLFLPNYIKEALGVMNINKEVVMVYPLSRLINIEGKKLEIEGSNIHTLGLSFEDKLCKIVNNLTSCVSIHGLFKYEVAKHLPFKKTIGTDHLMLFATAFSGDIYELKTEGIYRRIIREETIIETQDRHESVGVYKTNKNSKINIYSYLAYFHYMFLFKNRNIFKMYSTLRIIKKLARIFNNRFDVKTKDVKRIFWKNIIKF